jgi:histidine triad (HIT) family protein
MNYNKNNIFAKILRDELPSEKIYEDDALLIINDKYPDPKYKIHLLCMPKNDHINFNDFVSNHEQIDLFFKKMIEILNNLNIHHYQLTINNGEKGGQEIMHMHIHIKSNDEIKILTNE